MDSSSVSVDSPVKGQNTMIAPSQPIIVSVGSDVTLPCQLDSVKDLRNMVVEWARQDLTPRYVHIRRDGLDLLIDQNPLYLGRTALSESRLQKGDMTLSLTRVKLSDRGTYRCYIPQMDIEAEVTLLVVSVAPPSVSLTKERSGSLVLRCESRGWYPKPELEWLDSEGTVLLRTEAQKEASDELFSVSSRLSVEQKHGNTFTCRVRQKESGQTRETQLILTDEFLEACSSCAVAWVLFGLFLCLVAAGVAAAFVLWKLKMKKTGNVTRTDIKEKDCEEAVPMLKQETKSQSGEQKLTDNQEEDIETTTREIESIEDLTEELLETKRFLLSLKEKLSLYNHELSCDIEKKKEKICKKLLIRTNNTKKKDAEKIQKLEKTKGEFENINKDIDKEMSKIDKIVRKTSEKKGRLEGEVEQKKKRLQNEIQPKKTVQSETKQEVENEVNDQSQTVQTQDQMKETNAEQKKDKNQENGVDDITIGQNTLIVPSQPLTVLVGSDVTLPCQLDPVKDLREMVVEWARMDLTPFYVHIRRDGLDFLIGQNPLYLGRTALSESRLQKGDMSLSLTRVKPSDRGTYRCYIPQMDIEAEVTLLVVSVAPPSVSLTKERSGSPVLRCESRGWYPKPELEWLDSEGTVLLRTEAQKEASDELFSVSSRLSVEQKHGNTFTCRVRQKESGQTRETQLILTDEFLEACSSCAVPWVLFGLSLCLVAAGVAAFVFWKLKMKKTRDVTRTDIKQKDCEEALHMLKQVQESQREQKLFDYQEDIETTTREIKSVEDLTEKLLETKRFLFCLEEKLCLYNHELSCDIEKKKEKMKLLLRKKESKKKGAEKMQKWEKTIGEFENINKDIDKEMSKIDKIVRKTSEKKGRLEEEVEQKKKRLQNEIQKKTVQSETKQEVENEVNDQSQTVQTQDQMKETEAEEKNDKNKEISVNHITRLMTPLTFENSKLPMKTQDQIKETEEKNDKNQEKVADDLTSLMSGLTLKKSQLPIKTQEQTEAQSQAMESDKSGSTAAGVI
ncbi:hypothetical protein WMY93_014741 [Mugilogobius chulae]|uniref:Ig-like domain-containing protein n=1 Tax=Mugilogobius chulae TaxID=88201 RepID=A0AAW0P2F2_9GOBI